MPPRFLSTAAFVFMVCSAALAQSQTGIVTGIAGTGTRGYSGDDGPALNAAIALANVQNQCDPNRFEQTVHVAVDASGNVYFTDSENQRIRRISAQGIITTVAGNGSRPATNAQCEATSSPGDGNNARAAVLYNPSDIALLPNGDFLIADQQNNRIRKVTGAGVISTIAGSGLHNLYAPGIPATSSPMDWPSALAVDSSGVVYFAEMHSNRVGKIGLDGRLATVAGTGFPGFSGDGSQANTAQLRKPSGLAIDAAGNLYIADQGNHRIRKVAPNGIITTIAGTGQPAFTGDGGPAAAAALNTPLDVKADNGGNIYIADALNHRIRRIDSTGTINTIAGTGETADLNTPAGMALDSSGDLYVVDWQNFLIRKISFSVKPAVSAGGIVNAASFDAPVSPGSLISIFGQNLANSQITASSAPWPTTLADVSVELNGSAIPLYFVSSQQINAQLPVETAPGPVTLAVRNSLGASSTVSFDVAPAAVGVFQSSSNHRAVAANQDGTLNSPDHPEARGRTLVFYCTGQGAVNPPVPTGQAAPLDVLSRASLPVSATIGEAIADVAFLGLTPGFIGLAQANIVIPAGTPTGDAVPVIINVAGQPSNTTVVSIH